MKKTLTLWLSALLIACMLVPAPLALMEANAPDVIEAPVDEVDVELGEPDPAPAEQTEPEEPTAQPTPNEAETPETTAPEELISEAVAEEDAVMLEADPVDAELASSEPLPLEASRFPDPNFRRCLMDFDEDGDGLLSEDELDIAVLGVDGEGIRSLEGLEYFPALQELFCYNNELETLDVSKNKKLEELKCYNNQLTWLDVSNSPMLRRLDCTNNAITQLDISELALGLIAIEDNVWKEDDSTVQYITNRYELAVDKSVKLITGETESGTGLSIDEKHFPDEVFREWVHSEFDINYDGFLSKKELEAAKDIDIYGDEFSILITSLEGIEYLEALEAIWIDDLPYLSTIDVSQNKALKEIELCNCDNLKELNLGRHDKLNYLVLHEDSLTTLDISGCPILLDLVDKDMLNVYDDYYECEAPCIYIDEGVKLITEEQTPVFQLIKDAKKTMNVGEALRIDLGGATAKNYSSDKASVATVDNSGVVKALKEGTATITVLVGSAKRKLKLTVVDPTLPTGIALNLSGTVKQDINKTLQLSYTLEPKGTAVSDVTWHSNDTYVASVDANGLVKFRKAGKVTISATTSRGKGGKKYTAKVKLEVVDLTLPTGIKLNLSGTIKQDLYKTLQLSYTLEPKGTAVSDVTWHSNDTYVASVDANGLVKFRKAGKVTLSATTTRGKGGKKYTAKVTLNVFDSKKPTGIHLNRTGSVTLDVTDDKTLNLVATLEPSTAESGITWKSSAPKIASVQNGVVTIHKIGSATITATADKIGKATKVKLVIKDMHAPKAVTIAQGKKLTLAKGKTAKLTATVVSEAGYAPRSAVTWTSSKPKIVSVDKNGNITALSSGSAKITVTAEKKSATITVTVPK